MTATRTLLVLASTLALAACGGTGGGTSTPAPVPTTNLTLPATQRAAAQSAISVLAVGVIDHAFASGTGPALLSLDRQALFAGRTSKATSCINGQTLDVLAQSPTGETTEAKIYYDAACTQVASDVVDRLGYQSQPRGVTLDAAATFYTRTGTVAYTSRITGSLQATLPSGVSESITETLAPNASSPPFETLSYACTLALSGGNLSGPCTQAAILTPAGGSSELGEIATFTQTVTTTATSTTIGATGSYRLLSGASGSIVLTAAPAPTLTGGTTVSAGAISEALNFTGSAVSGTLTTTDMTTRLTTTIVPAAQGYTGTIARDGTTFASFTIDAFGNGTISYTDGTTGTITGFVLT
jgi:hypothetical protein